VPGHRGRDCRPGLPGRGYLRTLAGPWFNGAPVAAFLQASRRGETGLINAGNIAVSQGLSGIGPAIFTAILLSSFIGKTGIPAGGNYNIMWWACAGFAVVYVMLAFVLRNPTLTQEIPAEVEVVAAT